MATRDNYHGQAFVQAIDPQLNDDNNEEFDGETIDTQGFDSVAFAASVGASGVTLGASIRIEFFLEHAEDDGTGAPDSWEDVPAEEVHGAVESAVEGRTGAFAVLTANAQAEATYACGYAGARRFVRASYANVGTHAAGTPVSAVAVLGHAHVSPVN